MKTSSSFCAAAGVLAAGLSAAAAQSSPITAQQAITLFNEEDFAFSLGGPEPSNLVDNFQLRGVNVNQLPALDEQGISMALVNLGPCAINLPHIHPRATEMLYTIEGRELQVAFVEENGGEGAVVNDLAAGDVAFFPQGLIHYQQNPDCYPATFLAALNSEDPGVVTITTRFFELPNEAIKASLNVDDPTLKKLIASLPQAPALAQRECLQRCGLLDDDKHSYNYDKYSDSVDSDSGDSADSDSGHSDSDSNDSDSNDSDSDSGDYSDSDSIDSNSNDSDSDSNDSNSNDSNSNDSDSDSNDSDSNDFDSNDSDSDSGDSGDSNSDDYDSGDSHSRGSDSGDSDSH